MVGNNNNAWKTSEFLLQVASSVQQTVLKWKGNPKSSNVIWWCSGNLVNYCQSLDPIQDLTVLRSRLHSINHTACVQYRICPGEEEKKKKNIYRIRIIQDEWNWALLVCFWTVLHNSIFLKMLAEKVGKWFFLHCQKTICCLRRLS